MQDFSYIYFKANGFLYLDFDEGICSFYKLQRVILLDFFLFIT